MKTIILKISIPLFFFVSFITACNSHGNTGNGSMDTGVKEGSGYSDSLNTERGQLDTSTTPSDRKRQEAHNH